MQAGHWGLCVAGLVDRSAGVLRYSSTSACGTRRSWSSSRPSRVVFANDLDAAAVGEADGGTLALLQVGTGIAGRFVVDGDDAPVGHRPSAGEVGHLRFRDDGLPCSLRSASGCAEAYGSWGPRPALPAAAEPSDLPPDVVAEAHQAIGFAAAALVATSDPGTLRIGGGLAAAWGETLSRPSPGES